MNSTEALKLAVYADDLVESGEADREELESTMSELTHTLQQAVEYITALQIELHDADAFIDLMLKTMIPNEFGIMESSAN